MSEFRWSALIALWCILIGPILDMAPSSPAKVQARSPRPSLVKAR